MPLFSGKESWVHRLGRNLWHTPAKSPALTVRTGGTTRLKMNMWRLKTSPPVLEERSYSFLLDECNSASALPWKNFLKKKKK